MSRARWTIPKTLTGNAALREYYLALLDQLESEFAHVHYLLRKFSPAPDARAAVERR